MQSPSNDDDIYLFIASYEQELNQRPNIFLAKFLLMLIAGYLLIFSIGLIINFLIFISVIALIKGSHIEIISNFLSQVAPYLVAYSLLGFNPFVKYYQPKGYEINAQDFPLLFAELEQLNQKQKAPRIDKVVIVHSYTSVYLEPLFLYFGWYKRTLSIDINLMLINSPEQMRSVLAHEWIHLNNRNNKLGVRAHIINLHINFYIFLLQKCHLHKLADWLKTYRGTLNVYSMVSNRQTELVADANSEKLTGKQHTIEALLNSSIYVDWIYENYWQPLFDLSRILPTPPETPYSDLQSYLQTYRFNRDELELRTQQALSKKTEPLDFHPSLKERISLFTETPEFCQLSETSAAQVWFGEKLDSVITEMNKDWHKHHTTGWQNLHIEHKFKSAA